MWIRFSLYLLLVFCALARSDESPHQKQREDGQNEDQPPYIILPSYGLFQRQPVMMGRNNLAFLLSATTTTITTTSTSTCTFSTAAQCIGRRRRELAIEELADVADLNLDQQDTESTAVIREERKADPAFIADPFLSYHQYQPRYVIEPSFERSSYYQFPRRLNPLIAQPPEMARLLFGGGLTFTSTTTITTTSSWRPICSFPGAFQVCLSF